MDIRVACFAHIREIIVDRVVLYVMLVVRCIFRPRMHCVDMTWRQQYLDKYGEY
jgi:hypothetical protein